MGHNVGIIVWHLHSVLQLP